MSIPLIERVRSLAGGGESARVELVRIDGVLLVLKTHRLRNVAAERLFHLTLKARDLPCLDVHDHPALARNQILLDYVDNSPTIGSAKTLDQIKRFGEAVRALHAARSARFTELDNAGVETPSHWPAFLEATIDRAMDAGAQTDLPEPLLSRVGERLETLAVYKPAFFVLAHGDLHLNNALIRGQEIVLFDKAASVWLAPPMFDLCLIFSEAFPGARYGVARRGDDERLRAFFAGYGALSDEDERWIDHFVLLRSLPRYPSPFVPELRDIIEAALARTNG